MTCPELLTAGFMLGSDSSKNIALAHYTVLFLLDTVIFFTNKLQVISMSTMTTYDKIMNKENQ